jgi:thymidine kinase
VQEPLKVEAGLREHFLASLPDHVRHQIESLLDHQLSNVGEGYVCFGPMCGGKSNTANTIAQFIHVGRKHLPFIRIKPSGDKRNPDSFYSRVGIETKENVYVISGRKEDGLIENLNMLLAEPCLALIDEMHFFGFDPDPEVERRNAEAIRDCLRAALYRGCHIVVAGLDMDAMCNPFWLPMLLLADNDYVKAHCLAKCSVCGDRQAAKTQRLQFRKPAPSSLPRLISDDDPQYPDIDYEPRCRRCYVVPSLP